MAKYKVIRKCFWAGRKWDDGEVVDLIETPPHHFVRVSDNEVVTRVLNRVHNDPMKPKVSGSASTYSEMAKQNATSNLGFASSLKNEPTIYNPKEFKKPGVSK